MNVLHIAEPFYGAYSVYGWQAPIPGIGLSERVVVDALMRKDNIYITIGKDPQIYRISPRTVLRLAKKYNSHKLVRFGVRVAVIPQNKFIKVKGGEKYAIS